MQVVNILDTDFQVVVKNEETKSAILKQVSKIKDCLIYGGQYAVALPKTKVTFGIKQYMTLEAATDAYNKYQKLITNASNN